MKGFSLFLACCFLVLVLSFPSASVLSDKAAGMQPGTWTEMATSGYDYSLIKTGTDNILNYADCAGWDPNSKKVLFVGQGHMEGRKAIQYTESSNSWSNFTAPGGGGIGHGYDHNAIDQQKGHLYYRHYSSVTVNRYNISSGSWGSITSMPGTQYSHACCAGLEWFPEMNGLIFVGGGSIWYFNSNTNQWTRLQNNLAMGGYHNVAEYDPVNKVVYAGGGNGSPDLYKVTANGQITKIRNAPRTVGIYSAMLTLDPASGELLALGRDKSFYAYNAGTDAWRTLNAGSVPAWGTGDNAIGMTVAAQINTHGVIMFIKRDKIYLYKHKPDPDSPIIGILNRNRPGGLNIKPNPFRLSTTFLFENSIKQADINIYSIAGKQVAAFTNVVRDRFLWDAGDCQGGVYVIQVITGDRVMTGKVSLVR